MFNFIDYLELIMRHTRRSHTFLSLVPWGFLMIIYLLVTYLNKIPLEGSVGNLYIVCGIVVLIVEFVKSGSISSFSFLMDQFFAITSVIIATILMTLLYLKQGTIPNFYYLFGYAIIIGDSIFSPFNAHRMAIRNFSV